ncbi:hypothetical protein Daus18300_014421 [Diaporthe australafricana]|uniref:Rhodopsin domain-containing protein n=1 Tax=Diaporthe australafricana TaxID=127596 RepID=A0ABR3VVA8_9PEZI
MASTGTPVPTTSPLVSLEAFHGIVWGGFVLCVIGFSSRLTIRVVCFGRLFLEDYLMMLSLGLLLATAIIGQLCVGYIYKMVAVGNGTAMPSPDFMSETTTGLRSFGVLMILNYVGIWLVKLNFLLFFRRLGNHVKIYRICWWCVVAYNLAAGATVIGLIDFKCVMRPAEEVIATCSSPSSVIASYTASKVSCSLDAVGDAMIIVFPTWILWGCKVGLRKKLALSGIFGLVAFTIAVTIIRGSIFGGVYQSISEHNMKQLNITWIWFWFNIEFDVCSSKQAKLRERQQQAASPIKSKPTGLRGKAQALHDALVTTFQDWEDTTRVSADVLLLPQQTSGIMTMDFERGDVWNGPYNSARGGADSARTLEVKEASTQAHAF